MEVLSYFRRYLLRYQDKEYDLASFINSLSRREFLNFFLEYMLRYSGNEYGLMCFINSLADTEVINYLLKYLNKKTDRQYVVNSLAYNVCLFVCFFEMEHQNNESNRRVSLLAYQTQRFFNCLLKYVVRYQNNEFDWVCFVSRLEDRE